MQLRKWRSTDILTKIFKSLPRRILVVHSPFFLKFDFKAHFDECAQKASKQIDYHEQIGEPVVPHVLELSAKLDDYQCLISVGGGGVEDLSALASLQCSNIEELSTYLYLGSGSPRSAQRRIGYVSFPTNYSAGAYVTNSAVVHDEQNEYKLSAFGPGLRPDKVYIDPSILSMMNELRWKLSAVDTLTHFVEIYWSLDPQNSLYFNSLQGWLEDFENAFNMRSYDKLFFLSAYLMGGFFPLKDMRWPIHALAHSLGPIQGLDHASSLANLLPIFLDSYISKNEERADVLKCCRTFLTSLRVPLTQISRDILNMAMVKAIAMNSRLFDDVNALDEYQELLGY